MKANENIIMSIQEERRKSTGRAQEECRKIEIQKETANQALRFKKKAIIKYMLHFEY